MSNSYSINLARALVQDAQRHLAECEALHRAGALVGGEYLDRWAGAYLRLQSALAYRWLLIHGPFEKNPYSQPPGSRQKDVE